LCLHVAVNIFKNSVKRVWKEGTFFLSLCSQIQNITDRVLQQLILLI
jgi:hypothetical protein